MLTVIVVSGPCGSASPCAFWSNQPSLSLASARWLVLPPIVPHHRATNCQ